MKKRVLLDTNMLIYLLDNHILDEKVMQITRALYDSDEYIITIHPQTFYEIQKIKDDKKREIFESKLQVYSLIENPPKATKEFNELVGVKNSHDLIDNELLYALQCNCVTFLISNDKELIKKGKRIGLENRTLSIDEAVKKFTIKNECKIDTPAFITYEYLYNMNLKEHFFDSLRKDYKNFDNWFERKQNEWKKAYITRNQKNEITSLLFLKEEGEEEDYSDFEKPFIPEKRLKVSTFKVNDTGKRIGECFIKIIINEALKKNINEIYITTFETQEALISLLKEYGFKFYTYKEMKEKN